MKGKLDLRFSMANVARFRSRVEKPSKELTSQIRTQLGEVVADILNKNQLAIRAQMIDFVNGLGLKFKSAAHEKQVKDVTNNIFDTFFATSADKLTALVGVDTDEAEAEDEAPADEAPADEAPAEPAEADADDFE